MSRPQTLRELRLAAGLTQHELADSIGMSQTMICRWERGQSKPVRGGTELRLARALGVSRLDVEDAVRASHGVCPACGEVRGSPSRHMEDTPAGFPNRVGSDASTVAGGDE